MARAQQTCSRGSSLAHPEPADISGEGAVQDAPRPPRTRGDLRGQGGGTRPRRVDRRGTVPPAGVRDRRRPAALWDVDLPDAYVVKPTHGSGAAIVVSGGARPRRDCRPNRAVGCTATFGRSSRRGTHVVRIAQGWVAQLYGQGPNREWVYGQIAAADHRRGDCSPAPTVRSPTTTSSSSSTAAARSFRSMSGGSARGPRTSSDLTGSTYRLQRRTALGTIPSPLRPAAWPR